MTKMKQSMTAKTVEIDILFIDLETCTRCKGTDASLEAALSTVTSVLKSVGVNISVRKTLVDTEQKAAALGFVSSPTIRVNGGDIALEFRESRCGSCEDACGCDGQIDCRVWVYEGREYTEAPEPMIVNAILSAVYGGARPVGASASGEPGHTVPENLKRFFEAKASKQASVCCTSAEQENCCAPTEKAACCGADAPQLHGANCGCR